MIQLQGKYGFRLAEAAKTIRHSRDGVNSGKQPQMRLNCPGYATIGKRLST
jgi:hypothetical protein